MTATVLAFPSTALQEARGYLPSDAEQLELVDVFACLLETGHTVQEAAEFMTLFYLDAVGDDS